jgi:ketosteroid isomerase-like protein
MTDPMQMVLDRAAIAELVVRFDDAVNRRDPDEFARLWTENAVWEIGDPMPMHAQGRDTIVKTWTGMVAGTEWLFRGSFAGVINVDGDQAAGRWPCVETGTFKARGGEPAKGYDNRAIYEDRYVCTADGWRFQYPRYLYLWLSNEKLPGNAVPLGEEIAADDALGQHASALAAPGGAPGQAR